MGSDHWSRPNCQTGYQPGTGHQVGRGQRATTFTIGQPGLPSAVPAARSLSQFERKEQALGERPHTLRQPGLLG